LTSRAHSRAALTAEPRKARAPSGETIRYGFGHTSVAAVLVGASRNGIVAILIREQPDDDALVATLRARFPRAELYHDRAGMRQAVQAVVDFVEKPRGNIALRLDIRGTEFQRRVWAAAMSVPFGETTTFAEIARKVSAPRAVRAVGNACSQNPLEFAIPCHRVLRSDGSYSGGSPWGDHRQSTIVQREAKWAVARGERAPRPEPPARKD
jgi:AraC family transcriptional regulator, regulatory protein of adaptative response / methylated-DNA-[protein]-cysteine methyltransferase